MTISLREKSEKIEDKRYNLDIGNENIVLKDIRNFKNRQIKVGKCQQKRRRKKSQKKKKNFRKVSNSQTFCDDFLFVITLQIVKSKQE